MVCTLSVFRGTRFGPDEHGYQRNRNIDSIWYFHHYPLNVALTCAKGVIVQYPVICYQIFHHGFTCLLVSTPVFRRISKAEENRSKS